MVKNEKESPSGATPFFVAVAVLSEGIPPSYHCFVRISNISNWLNGSKDFASGLELYEHFAPLCGHPMTLHSLFKSGENDYTAMKLEDELTAINDKGVKKEIETSPARPKPSTPPPAKKFGDYDTSSFPIDLQEKHKLIKERYAIIGHNRGRLRELMYTQAGKLKINYPERLTQTLAQEIVHFSKWIKSAWMELDYFRDTGRRMNESNQHNDELSQLREWLRIQPKYINYCRKQESKKDVDGALYQERKAELQKMDEYLKKHE